MGIHNLKTLIKTTAAQKRLSDYSGKRAGVDTSIWIYRFIYRDDDNAVVDGLLKQIKQFHRHKITPVYIFDGKAESTVKIEVERRKQRRELVHHSIETLELELEETLENLGDDVSAGLLAGAMEDIEEIEQIIDKDEEIVDGNIGVRLDEIIPFSDIPQFLPDSDDEDYGMTAETAEVEDLKVKALELKNRIVSLQRQSRRPTKEAVADCKRILELLGIPYVQAPGESDITLSELIQNGSIDMVMSEDTDMLPYGCHTFVTGLKEFDDTIVEYRLEEVLQKLDLTREQFIDVCILCGCDYAEKIFKIGVKKGFDLIKQHKTIENVLEFISRNPKLSERHTYPIDFLEGVVRARNMFLHRCATGPECETPPATNFVWNQTLAEDNTEHFKHFLLEKGIPPQRYMDLCLNWSGRPRTQRSILDFYKR